MLVQRVRTEIMAIVDEVEAMIARRPGLTETELAKALYGSNGYPQQVNAACRTLLRRERIERRGKGYSEPFTYYPAEAGGS